MTKDDVISYVASYPNRADIARGTGLRYQYLCRLAWGHIKNPGADQVDKLRDFATRHPMPEQRLQ